MYSKEGFKKSLKQITVSLSKRNLGMLTALTNEDKKEINEILAKMDSQKELIRRLI